MFSTLSIAQKLQLLSLLSLIAVQSPSAVIHFLSCYMGVRVAKKSVLSECCETEWRELACPQQIGDEELALLRHILLFVFVNSQISTLSLDKEERLLLNECMSLLEELIESTLILGDSPMSPLNSGESELFALCRRTLSGARCTEEEVKRGDLLVTQYVQQDGLRTGNGGAILFHGQNCVLSLGDLPELAYLSVNSYLVKAKSISYSALVCRCLLDIFHILPCGKIAKIHFIIMLCTLVLLFSIASAVLRPAEKRLSFRADGTFTVMQVLII